MGEERRKQYQGHITRYVTGYVIRAFVLRMMREKTKSFLAGPLSGWSLHILPTSASLLFPFPPTSQRYSREINWHIYIVPVWVGGCVCEWPCHGRAFCPGLAAELLGQAPTTRSPGLEQWIGKELSYLFLFIFLKWMYSSYLFVYLILEVLWVFGSLVMFL